MCNIYCFTVSGGFKNLIPFFYYIYALLTIEKTYIAL